MIIENEDGVGIRPSFRKKGYAKEAINVLLNFYFSEFGFQKVNANVYGFKGDQLAKIL